MFLPLFNIRLSEFFCFYLYENFLFKEKNFFLVFLHFFQIVEKLVFHKKKTKKKGFAERIKKKKIGRLHLLTMRLPSSMLKHCATWYVQRESTDVVVKYCTNVYTYIYRPIVIMLFSFPFFFFAFHLL